MSDQWRALALCAAFPALPWIGEPSTRSAAAVCAMTVVCQACPVRIDCAAFVEARGVSSGFWAGSERGPADSGSEAA